MIRKKIYGESRVDGCPFCGQASITTNSQKVPTCEAHKKEVLENLKCVCGELLDVAQGKYGPFFVCIQCGNINFKKGLETNGYPLISVKDL